MNTYSSDMSEPVRPKHSGFGIASFVLSMSMIVIGLAGFVGFIVSVASSIPQDLDVNDTPEKMAEAMEPFIQDNIGVLSFFGLSVGASILCALIGLILGIVGILQKDRRKGFAVTGTIINGGAVLMSGLFLLIALAAAAGA